MEFDFTHFHSKHWFPGHMLKASRQIKDKLKLVDLAIILTDARIPSSSINSELEKILEHKAVVYAFNKADLAEKNVTQAWLKHYRSEGKIAVTTDVKNKRGIKELVPVIRKAVAEDRKKRGAIRPLFRPIRVMIIGVPNVGKSSLINALKGKKQTKTGQKPGVTRHQQWVNIAEDLELLDTPGIMAPSGQGKEAELKMAVTNIIRQDLVGKDFITGYIYYQLLKQKKTNRLSYFKVEQDKLPADAGKLLEHVATVRELKKAGDTLDLERAADQFVLDFTNGKLGYLSLDIPEGFEMELNDTVTIKWKKDED